MKKSIICNTRILQAILVIVFSVLFIFIALNPSVAYASDDDETHIGQVMNLMSYSANEADESSNEQAGYLEWAASGDRSGVYFYVITERGTIAAQGILLDRAGVDQWGEYADRAISNSNYEHNAAVSSRTGQTGVPGGYSAGSAIRQIEYIDGISPVYYSGGWQAKGSAAMSYLTQDSGWTASIKGVPQSLPNWAYYVAQTAGGVEALQALAKPETKWSVILEPVSVNYLYTNNTFKKDTQGADGTTWIKGSPKPAGVTEGGKFKPIAYIATGYRYIDLSSNVTGQDGGGKYTYKFYNTQLPYSLCLDHDIDVSGYSNGGTGATSSFSAVSSSVHRLSSSFSIGREGVAMAAIDVTGFTLPPIHTFDGTNTPGNTETPDPDKGTNGECVIKKYYYTELLNSDGTIKEAETDPHHYTRLQTTNYISVDGEEGYELVGWKSSSSNMSLTQKSHFDAIPAVMSGTSPEVIKIQTHPTPSATYLYVLLKKTEVAEPDPDPWDFRLEQSQITKRVSFLDSVTTSLLFTHQFSWTAPAPSIDECRYIDDDPSGHAYMEPGAEEPSYEVCGSFEWIDNSTALGLKLDRFNSSGAPNPAVLSRYAQVNVEQPTVTIISDIFKHYKQNNDTRGGSGSNTQRYNSFNFIAVLFRGNDHLTLADWKNGSVPYLTSIAQAGYSQYNFKSSNKVQGTRKAGKEYYEKFTTKFVDKSVDTGTFYGATSGDHGRCYSSTSTYRFNNSSALEIKDIKVNIQVFWAKGVSPSSKASNPSKLMVGSIRNFTPYIRMRYDNNTQKDVNTNVLSQFKRSVTVYDYASVGIQGGATKKLDINSSQWSTHAKAQENIIKAFNGTSVDEDKVKSSILPGGATLSISVDKPSTQHVVVTSCQAYLTGSGKTQVDKTGGSTTLETSQDKLKANHEAFASSIESGLKQAYIGEFITKGAKKKVSEVMSSGQLVKAGSEFKGNGTTFSSDSKYHFNKYNDSRLNVHKNKSQFSTYTFYVDVAGNIRCSVNNTSPDGSQLGGGTLVASKGSDTVSAGGTIGTIAKNTGIVTQLRKGLIDNEGDDKEAPWASDGKWYNEAFDGVTYLYGTTVIDIGIWDPLERGTVLDPKETSKQTSTDDFFNKDKFNTACFVSQANSGSTANIGTFTNTAGNSKSFTFDFSKLYQSDVFYIPNVTTQDLR